MIRYLKWAIWLYLILLLTEGALRKWFLPSLAEPLLVVRDPVVLLIYILALAAGVVPRNGFLIALGGLVIASVAFSFLAGQTNMLVLGYGLRTNYLHVPLIWVMAEALDRRDVERLGWFVLLAAIPMTIIMVAQFRSPIDAFINRGVGGDETGGQIYGALGRIRPPGAFSFITGPMVFFPLAAAFFLHEVGATKGWRWFLTLVCGLAIIVAMPVSISRGTAINTGLVGIAFVLCLLSMGLLNMTFVRAGLATVALLVALAFLPVFQEGMEAFLDRWDTAAAEVEGDAWGSLTTRVTAGFISPFYYIEHAPFFGQGIGVGSNVGARLLAGQVGFLLAEDEWGKILLELGPLLGLAFILFRVVLTIYLFWVALRALRTYRDPLPMLLCVGTAPAVLLHQWAPPTLLGFSVFGAGLLLASVNYPEPEYEEEEEEEIEEVEEPAAFQRLAEERRRLRGLT